MDEEIFLSFDSEQVLVLGERILFIVSSVLNVTSLFCLIRETPAHQSQIKGYLLFIQAMVIATDVYFCVLLEPFPLFQVVGGYCVGILCQLIPPSTVLGIFGAMAGILGASIVLCTLHRHQTIVHKGKWFLSTVTRSIIQWTLLFAYSVPFLVFAAFPFDQMESERLIDKSPRDLRWIRERGGYFVIGRSVVSTVFATLFLSLVVLCSLFVVAASAHMYFSGKSEQLKRTIQRSLGRFFIQINVPILFIALPFSLLFLELIVDCFSFQACLFFISIIPFHPIAHNVILLLIVEEYRRFLTSCISSCIRKPRFWRKDTKVAAITTKPPESSN